VVRFECEWGGVVRLGCKGGKVEVGGGSLEGGRVGPRLQKSDWPRWDPRGRVGNAGRRRGSKKPPTPAPFIFLYCIKSNPQYTFPCPHRSSPRGPSILHLHHPLCYRPPHHLCPLPCYPCHLHLYQHPSFRIAVFGILFIFIYDPAIIVSWRELLKVPDTFPTVLHEHIAIYETGNN